MKKIIWAQERSLLDVRQALDRLYYKGIHLGYTTR